MLDFDELWARKQAGHKYMWNVNAVPKNNKRWGVRLYHSIHGHCLRSGDLGGAVQTNTIPPGDYHQCEKCFPRYAGTSNRQANEDWQTALRIGFYQGEPKHKEGKLL
jgi:hypothetical protein